MKRWIIPLVLFFSVMCIGLCFVPFIQSSDLNCTKQTEQNYNCQITKKFFGTITLSDRKVEVVDIVNAENCDLEGCSYRAEFVTSHGGRVPLTINYTDTHTAGKQVSEIKSKMSRGEQTITYRSEPSWWVLFMIGGMSLMAFGLGAYFTRFMNFNPTKK